MLGQHDDDGLERIGNRCGRNGPLQSLLAAEVVVDQSARGAGPLSDGTARQRGPPVLAEAGDSRLHEGFASSLTTRRRARTFVADGVD